MADLVQYDIFGNPVSVDVEKEKKDKEKKKRNSERAKKAAETRRKKREEFKALWYLMYFIARECENGDLFGETHTEEERKKAEVFIQMYEPNGKRRKHKEKKK